MTWLYKLNVIDGPLPLTVWGLTIVVIILLLIRRPTPAWLWRIVLALAVGFGLGAGLVMYVDATHAFGRFDMPRAMIFVLPAGLAAVLLGVVSFWERSAWRKTLAGLLVVLAALSLALGANAAFGSNKTVGAVLGVSSEDKLDSLPGPAPTDTSSGPLYQVWTPPSDMPGTGKTGTPEPPIPSGSAFQPRPPVIYLPPAAQSRGTPVRLPLIVMAMGHPGSPDATVLASVLNDLATKNKGLAPIVIVADQLGPGGADPTNAPDPVCTDSAKYGDVDSYFNVQIPKYALENLNVITDHRYWTIMGYSNGGACAFTWATHHPDVWGNVVAISPDPYPGVDNPEEFTRTVFHGDTAAFEANKAPAGIAANAGKFAGHLAIFTVGDQDAPTVPGARENEAAAKAAGFDTAFHLVPHAQHVTGALEGGLPFAMELLYKRLGLSAP